MQVHLYGKEIHDGKTVTLDHSVQSFTIVVRSMSGVSPQTLKDLIQTKYEVIRIGENDRTDYVV